MSPPLRPTAPALRTEADAAPPASDARECGCPPEWLPPSLDSRPRVAKCWHRGDVSLILFRHFDLPSYVCLARVDATFTNFQTLFTDYESGLIAFYEARDAEVRLLAGEEEGR